MRFVTDKSNIQGCVSLGESKFRLNPKTNFTFLYGPNNLGIIYLVKVQNPFLDVRIQLWIFPKKRTLKLLVAKYCSNAMSVKYWKRVPFNPLLSRSIVLCSGIGD